MSEPVITACMCTGEPRPIFDEAGMPLLAVGGVCLCPLCGKNPFGVDPGHSDVKAIFESSLYIAGCSMPDSEGGV